MKKRIFLILLTALLAFGLVPATLAEDSEDLRYLTIVRNGITRTLALSFDADGRVSGVKEKMDFSDGDTEWKLYVPNLLDDASYVLEDDVAYRIWSEREIRETYGGMFPEDLEALIKASEEPASAAQAAGTLEGGPQSVGDVKVNASEFTLGRGGLSVIIEAENTGKKPVFLNIGSCEVNGWYVELNAMPMYFNPGVKYQFMLTSLLGPYTFSLMKLEELKSLVLNAAVYYMDGNSGGTAAATFENPTASAAYTQAYDMSGTVLHDDGDVKITLLRYDERSARVLLGIEKKADAKWRTIMLDTVADGFRLDGDTVCAFGNATHALQSFALASTLERAGKPMAESVRTYFRLSPRVSRSGSTELIIAGKEMPALPESTYPVVYEDERIVLRNIGHYMLSGTPMLLIECDNRSEELLTLLLPHDVVLIDGKRVSAVVNGQDCYPHTRGIIAVYSLAADAPSFVGAAECALQFNIYRYVDGYTSQIGVTGKLTIPLS